MPHLRALSGDQKHPFSSFLGGFALGDKEQGGDRTVHAYNTGWWLLMVVKKSLSGACEVPMVIHTQAAHTSNKQCRIRDKGTKRFWGINKPFLEKATEVFQVGDQTLRDREH